MAKKVDAWEADDGSLHKTIKSAQQCDRERKVQALIYEFANGMWEAGNHTTDFCRFIRDEMDALTEIVNTFHGPKAFTSEQLLNLYTLDIWGSQDGTFTHISKMGDNHLANAYKIANEEKRPGYEVYRETLLSEMTNRGLRKEVTLE